MNIENCYHYTQCGLSNIYLKNGYEVKETPYGKGVSIDNADGLHMAIAKSVIDKIGNLDGEELRFLRIELDLSQKRLGEYLGRTDQAVALWEKTGNIPKEVNFLVRHIFRQTMDKTVTYLEEVDRLREMDKVEHTEGVSFQEIDNGWEVAVNSC